MLNVLSTGCPSNFVNCQTPPEFGPQCVSNAAVCNGTAECAGGFDEAICRNSELCIIYVEIELILAKTNGPSE